MAENNFVNALIPFTGVRITIFIKKEKDIMSEKSNSDKRASKKAQILGTKKKNRAPLIIVFLLVVLFAAGTAIFMTRTDEGESIYTAQTTQETNANYVEYPVVDFENGAARHYGYKDGNMTIRYFILKSSDGVIRAAFDACDVCWPAGKGYVQDGDVMVCRNCGRRFTSVKINEVKGGCNPAPLERNIENGKLTITVDDILEGKKYFNFPGKA